MRTGGRDGELRSLALRHCFSGRCADCRRRRLRWRSRCSDGRRAPPVLGLHRLVRVVSGREPHTSRLSICAQEPDMKASLVLGLAAALLLAVAPLHAQTAKSEDFVTVQPAGQWLAGQFIGQAVTNQAGETIGNINDLLFDKGGRIVNVVIGGGGFLGIGEKNVAMPYTALSITADANGKRVLKLAVSKEQLMAAPDFKATEKTVYMRAKEKAGEMGEHALEKARELRDKATSPKSN